jgi:CheY-like chemotaxis protein
MRKVAMTQTDRSSANPEHKGKTLLVVEDDTGIGEFLIDALKMEASCRTLLATDGLQALEMVKTLVPDLFVLDYQLTGMDGLELADRLHAIEELKHIPILLLGVNVPKRELKRRQIASLDKPFELDELLAVIEKLLAG